jgi:hypothetical protein
MDNFSLNVTAEGITSLKLAMELAFAHNAPGSKVTHYSVREPKEGQRQDKPEGVPKHWDAPWSYNQEPRPRRLIFFWHKPEESAALPDPEPKPAPVRRGGIPGRQAQLGLFGNHN